MSLQPDIPTCLQATATWSTSPTKQEDESTSNTLPSFKLLLQALEEKHLQELAKLRFEQDLRHGEELRRCGVQAGDVDLQDLMALFTSEEEQATSEEEQATGEEEQATVTKTIGKNLQEEVPDGHPCIKTNGKNVQGEVPVVRDRRRLPSMVTHLTESPDDGNMTLYGRVSSFLEGGKYELFISTLILLSVLVMAVELQYDGYRIGHTLNYRGMEAAPEVVWPDAGDVLFYVSTAFTVVFVVDVAFRAAVLRLRFWRVPLNWLDFLVVVGGTLELVMPDALPLKSVFFRMLRLVKLARALRVIRFTKVLESLHLLLKSIQASVAVLFWSLCLLGIIQCIAGMTISQLVRPYLEDDSLDAVERKSVFRYYGTFTNTVLTMFEVLFANWSPPCRILVDHVSDWFIMAFILYRCLIGFAVLNVVTAVFVQQTVKVAAADQELAIMQRQKAAESYARKLRAFFHQLDSTGDGVLSWDEFSTILSDPKMLHWMSCLELESSDLVNLFHMIDDGDGEISADEFIDGAERLKGVAKSIDVVNILRITRRLDRKLNSMIRGCDSLDRASSKNSTMSLNSHKARKQVQEMQEMIVKRV